MRLESVGVQPNDSEDTGFFQEKVADIEIAGVVQSSLRQYDGHSSAGPQEVKVALDKQDVTPDFGHSTPVFFGKSILPQDFPLTDAASEWRIRHQDVKIQALKVA